jgi:hypothetical protein
MGHHQQQRQQRHAATTTVLVRALKDEQAKIDRIARQADQGDVWGNEVVGGAVKVRFEGPRSEVATPCPPTHAAGTCQLALLHCCCCCCCRQVGTVAGVVAVVVLIASLAKPM